MQTLTVINYSNYWIKKMTKNNIITFPKTNIREVKIKDIAKELETQMIKIKEQRELIDNQREEIMKSILDDE